MEDCSDSSDREDGSELLSYLDVVYSKFNHFEYQYATQLAYMFVHHYSKFDEILQKGICNLNDSTLSSRYTKLHDKFKSGELEFSENFRYKSFV